MIGSLFLAALLIGLAWRSATDSVDFPVYHLAGRQILQGNYELYPPALYDGRTDVGGHGFRYAPAIAFFFVPLALLPLEVAAFLFFCLKVGAFVHSFVIIARRLGILSQYRTLMWLALLITGGYLLEDFRGGNAQFLIVYLILLAFDWAEIGYVALPAAALAVAIATKITPVAILGYIWLRKGPAVAAVTLCLVALLLVAPVLVWGHAVNKHLLTGFVNYSASTMDTPESARNYSLRGVLVKYRPFNISAATASRIWIGVLSVIALGGIALVRLPTLARFAPDLEFALILTAMPILSPHSQRIYFSALCLPVAIAVGLLKRDALPRRMPIVAALVATMSVSTVLPLVLASKRLSRAYLDLSPYSFATVLLFLVLAAVTRQVKTAEPLSPNNS